MEQTGLNMMWERGIEAEDAVDGIVCKRSRDHDYLVDVLHGRLWSRSNETNVWIEAMPASRPSSAPRRGRTPNGSRAFMPSTAMQAVDEGLQVVL